MVIETPLSEALGRTFKGKGAAAFNDHDSSLIGSGYQAFPCRKCARSDELELWPSFLANRTFEQT